MMPERSAQPVVLMIAAQLHAKNPLPHCRIKPDCPRPAIASAKDIDRHRKQGIWSVCRVLFLLKKKAISDASRYLLPGAILGACSRLFRAPFVLAANRSRP